jgi:hypothetical protein
MKTKMPLPHIFIFLHFHYGFTALNAFTGYGQGCMSHFASVFWPVEHAYSHY